MKIFRDGLFALTAMALIHPARAADITAEQTALTYDLLEPLTKNAKPPKGTDPGIFNHALDILKQENLAGLSMRPSFSEKGMLEAYGQALFLGSRTNQFAPEIAGIRDLVERGDRNKVRQALRDLWAKAGRAAPDDKALEPVISALYGAKDQEPEETIHHVIDKPDHRVEITHARAGGRMQVDIISKNQDGSDKDRTSIQGATETAPTADKSDLERHIKLDKVCTSTPATDREALGKLAGDWKGVEQGRNWLVTNKGDRVTLAETRDGATTITYEGTFRLGRIAATHTISAVTDMEDNLPMAVRQQLLSMNIAFRVNLEFCGDNPGSLKGTWSSQHVTYNSLSEKISRIHDPYDLSLTLGKAGAMKVAEGAAKDEPL